jgi:anaerobic magnesium-protoporphyrin IX monomethyl ester cyclase
MNILLVNMPIEFNKRENLEPPLGICYLGAMVKDIKGIKVFLKDYEITPFSDNALKEDLSNLQIDVLGISFRTASYRSAKEFIKRAKAIKKNIFIVTGGHHATAFPEETLRDLQCDAVVRGEGEYTFKELVDRLMKNLSLEGLGGLTYRNGDSDIINNKPRPPIEDINRLPWPARELLNPKDYSVMTILTSRGCPFNCIYCDKGISTRKVKFRSPEDIFEEIKYIATDLNKKRLYIVDDHFFLDKNRLGLILDKMIKARLGMRWVCQARVDGMSEDILRKARESGCEQIMYGVETGDETELRYMRKEATLSEAENAVMFTKNAGITARTNFMLGFPVSTRESIRNTINFAKKLKPDIVRFFAVSPLPNTDLWDDIYGKGYIPENMNWDDIDFFRPSFDIKGISREEISLYVTAAYWHVLKRSFIKEITLEFLPQLLKLLYLSFKAKRIRGNISKTFPHSVNLILDNLHQIKGKNPQEIFDFLKKVYRLERFL